MKSVLLKISGEFFADDKQAIVMSRVQTLANEIKYLIDKKIKVAVVVGGGNIMRGGRIKAKYDRVLLDYIGMSATVVNGLALQAALHKINIRAKVDSALNIEPIATKEHHLKLKNLFTKKNVIIFGGTGLPYFSTDTATIIFGLTLGVDEIWKMTKVNGVYSADPKKNKNSRRFSKLSFSQVIEKGLQIMDQTAFTLAYENNLPIYIFKYQKGIFKKILQKHNLGTYIS